MVGIATAMAARVVSSRCTGEGRAVPASPPPPPWLLTLHQILALTRLPTWTWT